MFFFYEEQGKPTNHTKTKRMRNMDTATLDHFFSSAFETKTAAEVINTTGQQGSAVCENATLEHRKSKYNGIFAPNPNDQSGPIQTTDTKQKCTISKQEAKGQWKTCWKQVEPGAVVYSFSSNAATVTNGASAQKQHEDEQVCLALSLSLKDVQPRNDKTDPTVVKEMELNSFRAEHMHEVREHYFMRTILNVLQTMEQNKPRCNSLRQTLSLYQNEHDALTIDKDLHDCRKDLMQKFQENITAFQIELQKLPDQETDWDSWQRLLRFLTQRELAAVKNMLFFE
jgi:hypothetical protein